MRLLGLGLTLAALAWVIGHAHWYVVSGLLIMFVGIQFIQFLHFAERPQREVARFLNAVAFDDHTATFSNLTRDVALSDLGNAISRVLDQLRAGRAEKKEQSDYLQILVAQVPVALISLDETGSVQLLNLAARRLFQGGCSDLKHFDKYGTAFGAGIEQLKPGGSAIVRMERHGAPIHLKAAATGVVFSGRPRRLISLQNIETELSASELAAWQTVIRVMAHEVMNSLTPMSSLAATTSEIVADVVASMPPDDPHRIKLVDAQNALDTMTRRGEGLLQFVRNHRRITKRMIAKIDIVPVQRIFARLQTLLAVELAARNIELLTEIESEPLELAADVELLDQALINLLRNAMEALQDVKHGRISLIARREIDGRVMIAVSDNGPGIPVEQREKVFVPYFTTKRQGSGVGLTLVRQIATIHGATVHISDTPGSGATIGMRF